MPLCTVGSMSSRLQTWAHRRAAASADNCSCPCPHVHLIPCSHSLQEQDLPEHISPSPQPTVWLPLYPAATFSNVMKKVRSHGPVCQSGPQSRPELPSQVSL